MFSHFPKIIKDRELENESELCECNRLTGREENLDVLMNYQNFRNKSILLFYFLKIMHELILSWLFSLVLF